MTWYVTTEPCRVSVPCFEVCDPGGTERSCRCCTGPVFEGVSISPTSRGHLTMAMTSRGSPHGAGVSSCLVHS